MGSVAFNNGPIYHYTEDDTRYVMGPLMRKRLPTTVSPRGPGNP